MKCVPFLIAVLVVYVQADGTWTEWGTQGDTCANCPGSNYRGKTRVCIPGADGSACVGSRVENEICSCPTEADWGSWAAWTVCDKDCGFCGTQKRTRECTTIDECPNVVCTGDTEQSQACSTSDVVCLAPSTSCCPSNYKKKVDLNARRFYCGLA